MSEDHKMSEDVPYAKEKKKYTSKYQIDSSVDSEVVGKLAQLFTKLDEAADSDLKKKVVVQELQQFVQKELKNVIQLWNYYSNVNDHGKHTDCTLKLARVVDVCGREFDEPARKAVVETLSLSFITPNNLKVVYRGLSSMKPPTTNPLLRLLSGLVSVEKGALLDDFVRLFDFNLPVLPKLAVPSKNEVSAAARLGRRAIRDNFVHFWLALMQNASATVRKDLLDSNTQNWRKISANLFKYSSKFDSLYHIERLIAVFKDCILLDPLLQRFKGIFAKFFNQWNVIAILPYYFITEQDINIKFNEFINLFLLDAKCGIYRHTRDSASPVSVGNKVFKISNRFVYNILIEFKPWDNKLQLETVVSILQNIPELVPVYNNYLVSINNNFDPKLSFYWLGQTFLMQKIIQLPVFEDTLYEADDPTCVSSGAIEYVLPASLNAVSLSKCLKQKSLLIKHLALQLISFSFDKYERVVHLFNQSDEVTPESLAKFRNKFKNSLPTLPIVVSIFTDLAKDGEQDTKEHKLLVLTLTKVVTYYLKHITQSSASLTSLNKYFNTLVNTDSKQYSGIDLLLVSSFFQLQEYSAESMAKVTQKWYAFTESSSSLFTNLLKLWCYADQNPQFNEKVIKLACSLMSQTSMIVPRRSRQLVQLYALGNTLKLFAITHENALPSLWKLVDQTVSRVAQPYKYIDLAAESYHHVSPFWVVLFEQFQFVEQQHKKVCGDWLQVLSSLLCVLGEPLEGFVALNRDYSKIDESEFAKVGEIDFGQQLGQVMCTKLGFFELVLASSSNSLKNVNEVILNVYDLIGCLHKFDLALKSNDKPICARLFGKIENYTKMSSDTEAFYLLAQYFSSSSNCEFLESVVQNPVASEEFFTLLNVFKTFVEKNFAGSLPDVIARNLWVLDDDFLLQNFYNVDRESIGPVLSQLLARKLKIDSKKFFYCTDHEDLLVLMLQNKLVDISPADFTEFSVGKDLLRELAHNEAFVPKLVEAADLDVISVLSEPVLAQMDLSSYVQQAVEMLKSFEQGTIKSDDFLKVFYCARSQLSPEIIEVITEHFYVKKNIFTPYAFKFAESTSFFGEYQNQCLLYLNKKFAETAKLTRSLSLFITQFAQNCAIPHKTLLLDTHFEILFGSSYWMKQITVVQYIKSLLEANSKHIMDANKLLQILLSNDTVFAQNADTNYIVALLIAKLFQLDVRKNSTVTVRDRLLTLYSGTLHRHDLVLYDTLQTLETEHGATWTQNCELDDGETFIVKKGSKFYISIDKERLRKSVDKFYTGKIGAEEPACLQNYWDLYDPRFILLVVLSSSEFVKLGDTIQYNLKQFVQSSMLEYAIVCLGSEDGLVQTLSKTLLYNVFLYCDSDDNYRDKDILKILLAKILASYNDHESSDFAPILYHHLSKFVAIVTNPGHFLYEKAYKYLLGSPAMSQSDLPLYKMLISAENPQIYHKELLWLLHTIISGIKCHRDVDFLRQSGIIDYVLTLRSNAYFGPKIKNLLHDLVAKVARIDSDVLVTKFGFLGSLDMESEKLKGEEFEKVAGSLLKVDKMAAETAVRSSKKRVRDWTKGTVDEWIKKRIRRM